MALNYSLKYKKLNFYNKILLEKEGEIIIDRHCFRLKGKGAKDHGEIIYFSDIQKISILNNDEIIFDTFRKDRYKLSNFSSLFSSFAKDFFRVRNEYLADHLHMKIGMLCREYDGQAKVIDDSGEINNKGAARIQFYEGSIVIFPETQECFVVYFNFLKSHEFDEEEYVLKLYLENESIVQISKLRTYFADAKEIFEILLSKMYERIVNNLKNVLPDFQPAELLKLAYIVRDGKLVNMNILKKIHENLPKKVEELIFNDNVLLCQKIRFLMDRNPDSQLYAGFLFTHKTENGTPAVKSWFLCSLPASNAIAIGNCMDPREANVYFFRISFEKENIDEKLSGKILDFNQSMFLLRCDISPLYQEKHQLLKSRHRILFRKLSFLRHCRTSYLGKSAATDLDLFQKETDLFFRRAAMYYKNSKS